MLAPLVEQIIQRALSGTPEELLKWADESELHYQTTIELRVHLLEAQVPENVVDRLIGWTLEDGQFHRSRLDDLHDSINTWTSFLFPQSHSAATGRASLIKPGKHSSTGKL